MNSRQPERDGVFQPLENDDPQTVAGYRLAARLGAGGMGKVYLSYTPGGRPVAIKVIRPDFSQDPEFRRRFAQEVQSAQRVQGLYTAPVIDADTDGPQPWLATAYVPGPSLAEAVLAHGALPVEAVLLLVAGIAEALHVIHGAGIVHRDLKPSNVLLAADGPRVIDFGIARAADATALTGSGVTIGTPSFMAPEQAAGQRITPAADIFALGQIAVYASTGRPAFGEGTSHGVLYRIVHEEPDLDGVPERVQELVSRCLVKDPEARPSVADIIKICQAANGDTVLRRPEDWLPGSVAADITGRAAAPAPVSAPGLGPGGTPGAQPDGSAARAQGVASAGHAPTAPAAPAAPPPGFGPAASAAYQGPVPAQHPASPPAHGTGHPGGSPVPPPYAHTRPPGQVAPARGSSGRKTALAVAGALVLALAVGGAGYLLGSGGAKEGQAHGESGAKPGNGGATKAGNPSTGTSTGGGDAKADPPQAVSPVEYEGIDIPVGHSLLLADDPVKPRESGGDFEYHREGVATVNGAKLVMLRAGQEPSLKTCTSDTRYTEYVSKKSISARSRFCLLTSAGDVGLLTVKGFSDESDPSVYMKLDLTVWRQALEVDTSN